MSEKIEELRQVRIEKLNKLKTAGIDPYPVESERTDEIGEVIANFAELSANKKLVTLAGRIRSIRTHGKLTFGNLEDSSGQIQFLLVVRINFHQSLAFDNRVSFFN